VRIALGAQVRDIMRLVLGGGLRLTFVGTLIGLTGAWLLERFLAAEMPALATGIAVPAAISCAVLLVITLVACFLPARRAARINPLVALRSE